MLIPSSFSFCTWPGRGRPTDLKGVFSADVVRRLHRSHPEAQEGDATQDALLLLICRVNRGTGELRVPAECACTERAEQSISPTTINRNTSGWLISSWSGTKGCHTPACRLCSPQHREAHSLQGGEPGGPADTIPDAGTVEADEREVPPTLRKLTFRAAGKQIRNS